MHRVIFYNTHLDTPFTIFDFNVTTLWDSKATFSPQPLGNKRFFVCEY